MFGAILREAHFKTTMRLARHKTGETLVDGDHVAAVVPEESWATTGNRENHGTAAKRGAVVDRQGGDCARRRFKRDLEPDFGWRNAQ